MSIYISTLYQNQCINTIGPVECTRLFKKIKQYMYKHVYTHNTQIKTYKHILLNGKEVVILINSKLSCQFNECVHK